MSVAAESQTSAPSSEDRFNRLVAILTMSVAVLVAVVAYLQTDAAIRSDRYSSEALQFAMQASGARAVGATKLGYGFYTSQVQDELSKLAISAEASGDADAARRYYTVQSDLARLSPLLSTYQGDEARYESDLYVVESTASSERFAEALRGNDDWEEKSRAHFLHLALLAVALVLFGLSSTISGAARRVFLVTGCTIAGVTLVSAVMTAVRPITRLPDAAIDAYATGVGLAHQSKTREAVAAFTQALSLAPEYSNARYERANALLDSRDYSAAAADYERLRASGRDDANVASQLGWAYYLLGRFDEAIQVDHRVLELNPDPPTRVGARFNLALAELAAGQIDQAKLDYSQTMTLATQAVAQGEAARDLPYSFWEYLDASASDLDNLLDRLAGKSADWIEAPPRAAIANPTQVRSVATDLVFELKSLYFTLERTGQPPRGRVAAKIAPIQFASDEGDDEDDWEILEVFPSDTTSVVMLFTYEALQPSQSVMYRIYRDGQEDTSLRRPITGLGTRGEAEVTIPLVFDQPGEYMVEVYVEYQLVQRGRFTVEDD